jgi:peptidoglycan/xylan/chitin deacetylase (PgdA/CDA1 family)
MYNKLKVLFITFGILFAILMVVCYLNFKERKIIVFAYHKVVPQEIKEEYYKNNKWVDTTERFEQQMRFLHDKGYTTLSMNQYEEWRNTKKRLPIKTVVITIDDGDIETYYEMLPILKKYNFKATAFVIGEQVKESSEVYSSKKQQFLGLDLINKIRQEYPNLEIQSHSYRMHNKRNGVPYVIDMSREQIENDFDKMKFLNTDIYCYPYGVYTNNLLSILKDKNYRMAFTLNRSGMSRKKDNKYLINRVSINYDTSFLDFKKWLIKQILL